MPTPARPGAPDGMAMLTTLYALLSGPLTAAAHSADTGLSPCPTR